MRGQESREYTSYRLQGRTTLSKPSRERSDKEKNSVRVSRGLNEVRGAGGVCGVTVGSVVTEMSWKNGKRLPKSGTLKPRIRRQFGYC